MASKKEMNRTRLRRLERERGQGARQVGRIAKEVILTGGDVPESLIDDRLFAKEKRSAQKDVNRYSGRLKRNKQVKGFLKKILGK